MPINRCICLDVSFAKLKKYADRSGCDVEGLWGHFGYDRECRRCEPYFERMLLTGQTSFKPSDSRTSLQNIL